MQGLSVWIGARTTGFSALLLFLSWQPACLQAQEPSKLPSLRPRVPVTEDGSSDRILGVIPNYQTVDEERAPPPLTAKQKWGLAVRESVDPFNVANIALGAGSSQWGNRTPKYGEGSAAFGERFGAAWADLATQNLFSAGVFATLLHQDPRYFRRGPKSGIMARAGYAVSRIVVARNDAGKSVFNGAGIFGMIAGIGASNLYYPPQSQRADVMFGRLSTSLTGSLSGNLLAEFWPDIQHKFLHHKHKEQPVEGCD